MLDASALSHPIDAKGQEGKTSWPLRCYSICSTSIALLCNHHTCLNAVSLFQLKGKINMGHAVPLKSLVEKLSPTESMGWFSLNTAFKLTVMTVMNNWLPTMQVGLRVTFLSKYLCKIYPVTKESGPVMLTRQSKLRISREKPQI